MPSEYELAVQGRDLYSFHGNRVVESQTTAGQLVAVKVKPTAYFARSEAEMMHFASQQPGLLAPRVIGCYDIPPRITTTVTNILAGESLDKVWPTMTRAQQSSIKTQLKEQIRLMRTCPQPFIGRLGRQQTLNFYDRLEFNFMGPFETEEAFDDWCLQRVASPLARDDGRAAALCAHARRSGGSQHHGSRWEDHGPGGLGVQRLLPGVHGVRAGHGDPRLS
ncbi:hypothetical protein LOZ52_004516 [Ophidiomyces ophidiicola]|nr:hypothetical protein LOZ64_002372 [Ophidiomyces ophidiicola]KAI2007325.1 hypothetical protein LOZ50_002615 [Ophidiomyces ophidiicola]KAI2015134.1 hypothetical protein LOZ49_000887 [Ophidiomyces ophidiicola]KAI2018897.1 hypothetical protein LOZ46_003597 [Ophidiomyces ophidiicola]KAI2138957.1 hypothetical protein LOZ29_002636 [Ophidiomyces ophidiicola]